MQLKSRQRPSLQVCLVNIHSLFQTLVFLHTNKDDANMLQVQRKKRMLDLQRKRR